MQLVAAKRYFCRAGRNIKDVILFDYPATVHTYSRTYMIAKLFFVVKKNIWNVELSQSI